MNVSFLDEKYPSMKTIIKNIKPFAGKVMTVDASNIVEKETGSVITSNVFILGYAIGKKLLPIKKKYILEALKEIVPPRYIDMNVKVFEMGIKHK